MSEAAAATPKAKVAEPPAFLGNEDGVNVAQLNPAVGGFSVGFALMAACGDDGPCGERHV